MRPEIIIEFSEDGSRTYYSDCRKKPEWRWRFNDKAVIDAINKANDAAGCPVEATNRLFR